MCRINFNVYHATIGDIPITTTLDEFCNSVYLIPVDHGSIFDRLATGYLYGFGVLCPGEHKSGIYSACYIVKLYMSNDYIGTDPDRGKPVCFVTDVDRLLTWTKEKDDNKYNGKHADGLCRPQRGKRKHG